MNPAETLKREVFERMLDLTGRAFVVIRHTEGVRIGRRGFTDEEMQGGLVLVFNRKMKFVWGEDGIEGTLSFGGRPEECFIPSEAIMLVYSPELGAQLHVTKQKDATVGETKAKPEAIADEAHDKDTKVIKVDFSKGK